MTEYRKHTITIYERADEPERELTDLARQADEGSAYCDSQKTVLVRSDELPACAASFFNDDLANAS